MGAATAASTVTVSVDSGTPQPTIRQGELFYKQLTQAPGSTAAVKVTGVRNLAGSSGEDAVTEITRTAYVPATPEAFTHDADGNLTSDARWAYTWDGDNRLIAMETGAAALTAGLAPQKLEFAYDAQGRRISKKMYGWSGSAWTLGASTLFLYDGWNLIAELDATSSNATLRTYVWGLDLSGSFQGAGGVGGLLFSNLTALSAPIHAHCFDGNGNMAGLVDMATGAKSATYEYNAFGEILVTDGAAASANLFRFSAKYADSESGLLYYGLRYYSPGTGRWISRDPIEEQGGLNYYCFVTNDPVGAIDSLGLQALKVLFGAFIEGRIGKSAAEHWGADYFKVKGTWFDEPASVGWITYTDSRGFGGGTFRVKTAGTIDSSDIGQLKGKEGLFVTSSDRSFAIKPDGNGRIKVQSDVSTPRAKVSIVDKCDESRVTVTVAGGYTLTWLPQILTPDIDYEVTFVFKKSGENGTIEIEGWHNEFPSYEAQSLDKWTYAKPTPHSGPRPTTLKGKVYFKAEKIDFKQ